MPLCPLVSLSAGVVAVATLALAGGTSTSAGHATGAPAVAPCPHVAQVDQRVSLADLAAGRTPSTCQRANPETYTDLAALNGQRSAREVAPLGTVRAGAHDAGVAQAQALAAAGPATSERYQALGAGPLIGNGADYGEVNSEGLVNLSGRIEDFAYDPADHARWYAAVANGGVWRTDDAGAHWASIGDGLPTQITGTVAALPGGRILVGTGDPAFGGDSYSGLGAFYTDDQLTWRRAAGVPSAALSFQLAVDPSNPSNVYLATSKGLYRSTDRGASYANVELPTTCTSPSDPSCFFANVVTDVVVRPDGGSNGKVLAAVGWRAGRKPNAVGRPQAPQNGLYVSSTGAPGSFTYLSPSGFTPQGQIGRTSLGYAAGPVQDHDYVFAVVEDAAKFNGGVAGLDNEGSVTGQLQAVPYNTVLDGIYGSSDFGHSWTKLADATQLQSPATQSALSGGANGATYAPGVQAWYNSWIGVDPTAADAVGAPTHIVFGLEEVWQNTTSKGVLAPLTVPGTGQLVPTSFQVFGRYYGGQSCYGLKATLPAPCAQNVQDTGATTTHPDQHAGVFVPDASGGGATLVVGNDGGASAQHFGAGTIPTQAGWGDGAQGTGTATLHTLLPYSAAVAKDGTVWAGLQDNGELKISPDGAQYETFGGDGFYSAVDPDNSDVAYEEYTYGDMSVTTDGGKTWTDINPNVTSGLFATPFVMDPLNARHLVIGGRDIWETLVGPNTNSSANGVTYDAGNQWAMVFDLGAAPSGADRQLSAVDTRGNTTYVGWCGYCDIVTQGLPFTSGIATNAGASSPAKAGSGQGWHIAAAKGLPQRYVTGLAEDPSDPNTVYATLGGYGRRWIPPGALADDVSRVGRGHVFVSHDAGATFTDVSGNLPDLPAESVVRIGDRLIVGTDYGVYTTAAAAPGSWRVLAPGLPAAPAVGLAGDPATVNRLVVATYGRGVYAVTSPAVSSGVAVEGTVTAVKGSTRLTLSRSSKAVPYRRPVTLGGQIVRAGKPAVGVTVHLSGVRKDGKVVSSASVKTDRTGYYHLRFRPTYDATYTAKAAGLVTKRLAVQVTVAAIDLTTSVRSGVLHVRAFLGPRYALSALHEDVRLALVDATGHVIRILATARATDRGAGGQRLAYDLVHFTVPLPAGTVRVKLLTSAMPFNAAGGSVVVTVRR